MKESIRFILIYSIVSLIILVLTQIIFRTLSVEVFSFTIWVYIFYAIIGFFVFLLFGIFSRSFNPPLYVRLIFYAILCLIVLNSIPFFEENKILTYDLIKGMVVQKSDFISVGLHVNAFASFSITSMYLLYKNK